jgi:hypothetical protein
MPEDTDPVAARTWYERAAAEGETDAADALRRLDGLAPP